MTRSFQPRRHSQHSPLTTSLPTATIYAPILALYSHHRPATLSLLLLLTSSLTKNSVALLQRWLLASSLHVLNGVDYGNGSSGSEIGSGQWHHCSSRQRYEDDRGIFFCHGSWEEDAFDLESVSEQQQPQPSSPWSDWDLSQESYPSWLWNIPRGGGGGRGTQESLNSKNNNNSNKNKNNNLNKSYMGLLNLGNTCYLNAQLQCAFHVPKVRELVLAARDTVVEVEVEEDESGSCTDGVEEMKENEEGVLNSNHHMATSTTTLTSTATANDDNHNGGDNTSSNVSYEEQSSTNPNTDNSQQQQQQHTNLPKKTQQQIHAITPALRALQQTFHSLLPQTTTRTNIAASSASSYGTTQILCRTLGINPYIQQDGQEFWKLFLPELEYDTLTALYTGYYEDYIREIVVDGEQQNIDEEGYEDSNEDFWEEEKKEEYFTRREKMTTTKMERIVPRERVRRDPFLDLSIPVTEGMGCSIETSLRETFVQPEILRVSEGNGWRPSKHAEKVDAYKGLSLKREGLPSLLQLHLKRFRYDWESGETSKINDRCTFPLELDLSEIITSDGDTTDNQQLSDDDAIYDLQSVVIHRGEYGSGHYYSYVRPDIKENKWYRFDDHVVTAVDYNDVIADAYGGTTRRRRASSADDSTAPKRQRGILRRIFSLGVFGRENGREFGYGGRTSSAYMIQYVRRLDRDKLGY